MQNGCFILHLSFHIFALFRSFVFETNHHSASSPNPRAAGRSSTGFARAFITASANVTQLDPELKPEEIATTLRENVGMDSVLSNSFGFGGTNATLVMSKFLG